MSGDIYDKNLADRYTSLRDNFSSTDRETLGELYKVGIKGKKILDFGCGDGRYSFKFAEDGALEVIGVDISEPMIELANKKTVAGLPVKFLKIDKKVPVEDDYFDAVFSNYVLHYVKDLGPIFEEIKRVLKPGGTFISVLNIFEGNTEKETVHTVLGEGDQSVRFDIFYRNQDDIITALDTVGSTDTKYRYIDNPDIKIDSVFEPGSRLEIKTILLTLTK